MNAAVIADVATAVVARLGHRGPEALIGHGGGERRGCAFEIADRKRRGIGKGDQIVAETGGDAVHLTVAQGLARIGGAGERKQRDAGE